MENLIRMPESEAATLNRTDASIAAHPARVWSWPYVVPPVVYVLAIWLTNAYYMGDTLFYSTLIGRVVSGGSYQAWEASGNYSLWEFGHLLWRPLGVLLLPLFAPLVRNSFGGEITVAATYMLVVLNWLSGLATVVLLNALARRVCRQAWVAVAVTVAFIFTQCFLNYTQTGCSYVPGLALLLLGMYLAVRAGERPERALRLSIFAGIALAGCVALWVPFLWAVPTAVVAPLLIGGFERTRLRVAVQSSLTFGALMLLLFGGIAIGLGLHTPAEFKAWVAASSHGIANRGVPQVVFGFARSFINMGGDNVAFKRYLLHDPYSPVSFFDLLRLSLWKLVFFYLFLAAITVGLTRAKRGWQTLALLLVNAVPVLVFALLWNGTPMERYLPLFPALFLALARVLDDGRVWMWLRVSAAGFVVAMILTNFGALSRSSLARQHEATAARVREVQPLLNSQSLVLVGKDKLEDFIRDVPFNPVNYHNDLRIHSFLPLGFPQLTAWRQDVARRTLAAWQSGGSVFVSRRMFAERPRPEWEWVEGADARLSWKQIYEFFSQLETGQAFGGEDGFVLLARTPKNEQFLTQVAASQTTTQDDRSMLVR